MTERMRILCLYGISDAKGRLYVHVSSMGFRCSNICYCALYSFRVFSV